MIASPIRGNLLRRRLHHKVQMRRDRFKILVARRCKFYHVRVVLVDWNRFDVNCTRNDSRRLWNNLSQNEDNLIAKSAETHQPFDSADQRCGVRLVKKLGIELCTDR